jgi:hypothetical protein
MEAAPGKFEKQVREQLNFLIFYIAFPNLSTLQLTIAGF